MDSAVPDPVISFHPAIGVVTTCGAATIVAMTLGTEWQARGRGKDIDLGQCAATGAIGRFAPERGCHSCPRHDRPPIETQLRANSDATTRSDTRTHDGTTGRARVLCLGRSQPRSAKEPEHYTVRVTRRPSERRRLGGLELVSGMPVEVFLQTGSRTMMS
jgi:hypothetical protein